MELYMMDIIHFACCMAKIGGGGSCLICEKYTSEVILRAKILQGIKDLHCPSSLILRVQPMGQHWPIVIHYIVLKKHTGFESK